MADLSDYDPVHRELWPDQRVVDTTYQGSPFLGQLRKDESMGYDKKYVALQYSRPNGRSRLFATAQGNIDGSRYASFGIETVDDYGLGNFAGKLLRSSRNPSESFIVDVFERETMSALREIRRSLHIGLWGQADGVRGVVSAITEPGGGVTNITLVDPQDAKNFQVGMELQAAATRTGAVRAANSFPVQEVDLVAGTLVLTGTAITTDSWAVSDFLFADGDANNGAALGSLPGPMIAGVPAWIPTTAPTSGDDHFGVDRSVDVVRLAGWRFTQAGLGAGSVYESIMRGLGTMTRGGDIEAPDRVYMDGETYVELLDDLDTTSAQGETIQRQANDEANVYYSGVRIHSPAGNPVECFVDPQVPFKRLYLINQDTWKLHSIGMAPQFIEEDGTRILRGATADSFEFRMVYHAQLSCDAPFFNGVITLT